jgi:uncharacterized membrane protein
MAVHEASSDEIRYANLMSQSTKTPEDMAEIDRLEAIILSTLGENHLNTLKMVADVFKSRKEDDTSESQKQ